jgi:malonyl-CoA O-methyltransferase
MLVSALEGHSRWAPVYDSSPNPLLDLERRTVIGLLGAAMPRSVVDVACGTGRWMLHFHKTGAHVTGIDACPEMLAEAARHQPLRGRLILADAQALPIGAGTAGLVICSFAASYIQNLARLMQELARIAAPGGRVLITDMHSSAIAAGWRRSFKRDDWLYELEHFHHAPAEMHSAAAAEGLHCSTETEACFGDEERPVFARAGKQDLYFELKRVPAVWAAIWTKP